MGTTINGTIAVFSLHLGSHCFLGLEQCVHTYLLAWQADRADRSWWYAAEWIQSLLGCDTVKMEQEMVACKYGQLNISTSTIKFHYSCGVLCVPSQFKARKTPDDIHQIHSCYPPHGTACQFAYNYHWKWLWWVIRVISSKWLDRRNLQRKFETHFYLAENHNL